MNEKRAFLRLLRPLAGLLIVLSSLSFQPPVSDTADSFTDRIAAQFRLRQALNEQKLYLHLDKPYYAVGEQLFFKGYLLRATDLQNNLPDNFIYVDLIDRYDSLLIRKKFRRDSNGAGFTGNIRLPHNLQAGQYALRAYTHWMRNFGNESFFTRHIEIGNPIERDVQTRVFFSSEADRPIRSQMQFTDRNGKPYSRIEVVCRINNADGEAATKQTLTTDENGRIEFSFVPKQKNKPAVEVYFKNDAFRFEHTFAIPDLSGEFSVAFLPEGGNLLAGTPQKVAFKAIRKEGEPQPVSGVVLNLNNDTLARFASEHDGMGVFMLRAEAGEPLRAEVVPEGGGVPRQFLLPAVQPQGMALALSQSPDKVRFSILAAPGTTRPDSLYLATYQGDRLESLVLITGSMNEGSIDTSPFSPGISRFVLCRPDGTPLSSRLLFIRPAQEPRIDLLTSTVEPKKREKVEFDLEILEPEGEGAGGCYSVSVTDAALVRTDSLGENIRTRLWLTGDLKGYVHQPDYYFRRADRVRDYHLDLVMLTHGWARYDFKNLTDTIAPRFEYPAEPVQFVSGQVRKLFGGEAAQAVVSLIGTRDSISTRTFTDADGRFVIAPLDYRDSTQFVLKASNQKDKGRFEILPLEETVPPVRNPYPFRNEGVSVIPKTFLEKSFEQFIDSGGIPTRSLHEVIITANVDKSHLLTKNEEIVPKYSKSISVEALQKPGRKTLLDALLAIQDMEIYTQESYLTSKRLWYQKHFTKIFINDVPIDMDIEEALENVPFQDIKEIHIHRAMLKRVGPSLKIKPTQPNKEAELAEWMGIVESNAKIALVPDYLYNNIITIQLKSNYNFDKRFRPQYARFKTMGYTRPDEVYCPQYDTPQSKSGGIDNRSTLYWNPALQTDTQGKARLSFYTSDNPAALRITLEGVTPKGRIVRYEKVFGADR